MIRVVTLTLLALAFGAGLLVAWAEGWIGARPLRDCPTVSRTGACA